MEIALNQRAVKYFAPFTIIALNVDIVQTLRQLEFTLIQSFVAFFIKIPIVQLTTKKGTFLDKYHSNRKHFKLHTFLNK